MILWIGMAVAILLPAESQLFVECGCGFAASSEEGGHVFIYFSGQPLSCLPGESGRATVKDDIGVRDGFLGYAFRARQVEKTNIILPTPYPCRKGVGVEWLAQRGVDQYGPFS